MAKFNDNFNRNDNADVGANWDGGYNDVYEGGLTTGDLQIISNVARAPTSEAIGFESVNAISAQNDQFSKLTISALTTTGEERVDVCCRMATPPTTTWYSLVCIEYVTALEKQVAGVGTGLAEDFGVVFTPGEQAMLMVVGTALSGFKNGTLVISATDGSIASGRIGAGASDDTGTAAFDNFVGGDLPTHIAAAQPGINTNTTSFTITIPTVVAGDILTLACTNRDSTSDPVVQDDDTTGNPWTLKLSGNNTVGNASLWWKRATGATSAKTITASGFTGSCAGVLSVYRGPPKHRDPIENATYETNASTNETHAGFTPGSHGNMICLNVHNATNDIAPDTQSTTDPGALTERAEHLNTGGSDCSVAHASALQDVATATGNITWAQANAASMSIVFSIVADLDFFPGSGRQLINERNHRLAA